jgi:hypothetical protein
MKRTEISLPELTKMFNEMLDTTYSPVILLDTEYSASKAFETFYYRSYLFERSKFYKSIKDRYFCKAFEPSSTRKNKNLNLREI